MNELELTDDELESLNDLIAYVGGRIPDEHYAQRENFNTVADALDADHLNRLDVPDGWRVETDGGEQVEEEDDLDYPRTYDRAGSEHGTVLDAFDDLRAGDRVLWGDRKQPLTVARVVEPNDPEGQALTASMLRHDPEEWREEQPGYTEPVYGRDLERGDVFLNPTTYHGLTGRRFVLVHGPRGGFYAIARAEQNGSPAAAIFRAVRSYHSTKMGRPGEGAWAFEEWGPDALTVVEHGDAPDELDASGDDLPTFDLIKDRPLVGYDRDEEEHYEIGTVAEAFEEGLESAHNRAAREFRELVEDEEEDEGGPWADVPAPERVAGTPSGYSHSTVVVEEVYESEYGLKAVLDGPAPWETPDDETPLNEALKSTPWEENHRTFDGDRKAWTVDADELTATASVLRDYGYSVRCEYELPE